MKKTKVTIEYYLLEDDFEAPDGRDCFPLLVDEQDYIRSNPSIEGLQQMVDEGLLYDITEDKCKVVAIEVVDLPKSIPLPKSISDEEFDRKFDAGEDITDYIDYSTITRYSEHKKNRGE